MAKTASLYIQIDPETKAGAERLFSQFGITVTDAVNMFLCQSLLVGGLPFELKQPRYNMTTLAAMQEARDIISGKVQTRSYDSLAELNAELDAEYEEEYRNNA